MYHGARKDNTYVHWLSEPFYGLHVNVKKIKQKYLNHNLVLRIWNFSVYVAKHSCNDLDYGRPPVYRHNLGQSSL